MFSSTTSRALMVIVASATSVHCLAQGPVLRYRMVSISDWTPVAINDRGQIVGNQNGRILVRDLNGSIRNPEPMHAWGVARDIDDEGEVVGSDGGTGNWMRPVRWSSVLERVVDGGRTGQLVSIANRVALGSSWLQYPDGRIEGCGTAIDLNERREVLLLTGQVMDPLGATRNPPRIWINGWGPIGVYYPVDINDVGAVVLREPDGEHRPQTEDFRIPRQAVIVHAAFGGSTPIQYRVDNLPGGSGIYPSRMNNSFRVVGGGDMVPCFNCPARSTGFIHDVATGTRDVNSLIVDAPAGVLVSHVLDINDWGMMIGITNTGHCLLIPDVDCMSVTAQPTASCLSVGQTVTLTCAVAASGPVSFQWIKDGVPLQGRAGLRGTQSPSLVIENLVVADVGSYSCQISSDCGSVVTESAAVRLPNTLSISRQPQSQAISVGEMVTFRVVAQRSNACEGPLQYSWEKRNSDQPDPTAPNAWLPVVDGTDYVNARTQALTVLDPIPSRSGPYRCLVSDPCGCDTVYSEEAEFSVACPADFNADGGIDGQDIFEFFERWQKGC
jgi:hypothetical protein